MPKSPCRRIFEGLHISGQMSVWRKSKSFDVRWRKHTFLNEHSTLSNSRFSVDPQDGDRGSANGCAPDQYCSFPPKVPSPFLSSRIEQPSTPPGFGVDAGKVRALAVIVDEASKGQVARDCLSAMLFCNDVVDLKVRRRDSLRQSTILAIILSAFPHESDKCGVHGLLRPPPNDLSSLRMEDVQCAAHLFVLFNLL